MRVSVDHLKVGMKFSKTVSGKVLEVISIGDDGVVYYSGGETAVTQLVPHYSRPLWLVDAPKQAAPAPAPAPAPKLSEIANKAPKAGKKTESKASKKAKPATEPIDQVKEEAIEAAEAE